MRTYTAKGHGWISIEFRALSIANYDPGILLTIWRFEKDASVVGCLCANICEFMDPSRVTLHIRAITGCRVGISTIYIKRARSS